MFNVGKHFIDLLVTSVLDLDTLDSRPAMYSFCSLLETNSTGHAISSVYSGLYLAQKKLRHNARVTSLLLVEGVLR